VSSLNHKALLLAFVEVSVPTALAAICALVEARHKPFLIRANNTTLSAPFLHPNQPSASPVCTQQGFGVLPCRRCRWPVPAQTMSTTLKRPGDEQEAQLDESPRQHCSPTHNPTKPASLPFCWFFIFTSSALSSLLHPHPHPLCWSNCIEGPPPRPLACTSSTTTTALDKILTRQDATIPTLTSTRHTRTSKTRASMSLTFQ
jgi:hypothetical protein